MANCLVTTILIRHADTPENAGDDPDLSAAGVARANELADMLRDAGIGAIFVTDTRRSEQTAKPIAEMLGITPRRYDHLDDVVTTILDQDEPMVALVLGHSNTLPDIISGLGGPTIPDLGEREFDHLFVYAGGCLTQLRHAR